MTLTNKRVKATVNRQSLEYSISGTGSPTIVLLNGAGGPIEGWYKVLPELETLGTVLAYNRPGVAGSARPTQPQTGDVIITTLRELLAHTGLRPPYVLVGHSLGGLYANLFARLFPAEIRAVVLLDATAPDDVRFLSKESGFIQRALQAVINGIFPKDANHETNYLDQTLEHIDQAGPFPAIPLMIVTGGKPSWLMSQKVRQIRARNQTALVAMSPHGQQVIAPNSGHFPQFSEPEVVIQAIRDIIN